MAAALEIMELLFANNDNKALITNARNFRHGQLRLTIVTNTENWQKYIIQYTYNTLAIRVNKTITKTLLTEQKIILKSVYNNRETPKLHLTEADVDN